MKKKTQSPRKPMGEAALQLSFQPADKGGLKDELGRRPFASSIAQLVRRQSNDRCAVVGIEGEWGAGKSYVLAMVKEEIENSSNPTEIGWFVFNPWNFENQQHLISIFLRELADYLETKKPSLSKRQKVYQWFRDGVPGGIKILTALAKVGITLSVGGIDTVAFSSSLQKVANLLRVYSSITAATGKEKDGAITLDRLKQRIQAALKAQNFPLKRIIVVMEDLDRLNPAELRMIMQLIRGVADFKKVTYLLAYDRSQVVMALGDMAWRHADKDEARTFGEGYLQKVVDAGYQLPLVAPEAYANLLMIRWQSAAVPTYGKAFQRAAYWQQAQPLFIDLFHTPREAERTFNRAILIMTMLKDKSNPVDVLFAAYCMEFQPRLWEWLNRNMFELLRGARHLVKKENVSKRDRPAEYGFIESVIAGSIRHQEQILNLCFLVFPLLRYDSSGGGGSKADRKQYRICTPEFWESYFLYEVGESAYVQDLIPEILNSRGKRREDLIALVRAHGDEASFELIRSIYEIYEKTELDWKEQALPLLVDLAKVYDDGTDHSRINQLYWVAVEWINRLPEKNRGHSFCRLIIEWLENDVLYLPMMLHEKYGQENDIIKREKGQKKSSKPLLFKLSKGQVRSLENEINKTLSQRTSLNPGGLLSHVSAGAILFMWLRFNEEQARTKIDDWSRSDYTLMQILNTLVSVSTSSGLDTPQGAVQRLTIHPYEIKKIINSMTIEGVISKVEECAGSPQLAKKFGNVIEAIQNITDKDKLKEEPDFLYEDG